MNDIDADSMCAVDARRHRALHAQQTAIRRALERHRRNIIKRFAQQFGIPAQTADD